MRTEYKLAMQFVHRSDVKEGTCREWCQNIFVYFKNRAEAALFAGVRALLIDKDNSPKWDPPSVHMVPVQEVER